MIRYIDADEYIAKLSYYIEYLTRKYGDDSNTVAKTLQTVIDEIDHLPTADVQEVKHGKWIVDPDEGTAQCSACRTVFEDRGDTIPDYWGFCPCCGAKMDKESEDQNHD